MSHEAPKPDHEEHRVKRLHQLEILDTAPEAIFDTIAKTAAAVCGTPIALITLVDECRQWFKANVGLEGLGETHRDISICAHALVERDVLIIRDATLDPRFANNPTVTGPPGVRFYAGAPIRLSDEVVLGTLCVVDTTPRDLTESQTNLLRIMADTVARAMEFRQSAMRALNSAEASETHIQELYDATPAMLHSADRDSRLLSVSDTWLHEMGYQRDEVLGRRTTEFMTEASREYVEDFVYPMFFAAGRISGIELQFVRSDGQILDVLASSVLERSPDGEPSRHLSVLENVTERKRAEAALAEERERRAGFLEAMRAGTWEWDLKTGKMLVNARWAEMIGYTIEELGPMTLESAIELLHPDDFKRMRKMVRDQIEGNLDHIVIDVRVRHKDGHWTWVHDRGSVNRRGSAGEALVMQGVRLDISARKQSEVALRTSHSLLQKTGEVAGVGGWELDIATGSLTWSDEACRLYGLDPNYQPSFHEALSFFEPSARPVLEKAFMDGIQNGDPWDIEVPVVSATGRSFWARVVGSVEFDEDKRPVRLVGAFQDITARKEIERELADSKELWQVTLESIADAVITTDIYGKVTWLNPVAERLTGWLKSEAVGRPLDAVYVIVHETTRAPARNPVINVLAQGTISRTPVISANTNLLSRNGTEYGIQDSASPIRGANGAVRGAILIFHDVTDQRRLSNEIAHRATHDMLTGLPNRHEFEARISTLLERANVDFSKNALLYIDLDQFKLVNDACGHDVGDQLLREVSAIFRSCVRSHDTVARLGGDEFGIILEHADPAAAAKVAQKICDQMEEFRFLHETNRYRIGASIGLVPVDNRWVNLAALMSAADTSCYAAKEAGRNRVHEWFDSDEVMRARHGEMTWVSRLESALDDNKFELFGQRIIDLKNPETGLHCEVLLRLRESNGTITLPGAFIPAAERFQMAARIDRWVVRKVFSWMSGLKHQVKRIDMVAINLSGQSVSDRVFQKDIAELIRSATFDVSKICFEITETAAITHLPYASKFIDEVRALGVRIALDDFGAGFTSFSYLKALKVDYLKIDGLFIQNLMKTELDRVAVECFKKVADTAGLKTIAECVEFEGVVAGVNALGIDYAQGFFFHRPEPLDHLLLPTKAGTLEATQFKIALER
jgi:diguanylate cyclase (GGDEF)-like protein/PAS domain S-box-containing protein